MAHPRAKGGKPRNPNRGISKELELVEEGDGVDPLGPGPEVEELPEPSGDGAGQQHAQGGTVFSALPLAQPAVHAEAVDHGREDQGRDTPDQRVEARGIEKTQRQAGGAGRLQGQEGPRTKAQGTEVHGRGDASCAEPVIDPEHARQHRAEGQDRSRQARGVHVGDHHVVPVPQAQVGQLEGEPEHGGPRHEQGEGSRPEARDEGAALGPGDELVEGVEEAGPSEEEEEGGYGLHAESGEAVEARHPGHAQGHRHGGLMRSAPPPPQPPGRLAASTLLRLLVRHARVAP